jgi:hypothetical protein
MRAHELAKKLLEGPDFEVLVEGELYHRKPLSISYRIVEDGGKLVFIETDDDDRDLQSEKLSTEDYDDYDDDGYDDDE